MTARLNIRIEKTPEGLAQVVAEKIVSTLARSLETRKIASLVLSGGKTPRGVYRILGSRPSGEGPDWSRIHLFFSDERTVPPDHPDSNFGMARQELIDRIEIPASNVHRMSGELPPHEAAQRYASEIQSVYGNGLPAFDCVLLGVGEDGHTASLFPGTDALAEREQPVTAVFVPKLNAWRLTLTFPVLNNARSVIFLAEGDQKAPVLKRIFEATAPRADLPATMVRPHSGELHWMLDAAAGSFLRNPDHAS